MQTFLDILKARPKAYFVGGPLDGTWLAINPSLSSIRFKSTPQDERGRILGPNMFDYYELDDSIMPDSVREEVEAAGRNESRFRYLGRKAEPESMAKWQAKKARQAQRKNGKQRPAGEE